MLCVGEPQCLSYNLCGGRLCTLNNISAFHSHFEANVVLNDTTCVYVGMNKNEHPNCTEKRQPVDDKKQSHRKVDIQDDSGSSKCKINLKRIDGKDPEWRVDAEGWRTKQCQNSPSHGGVACPVRGMSLMTTEYYTVTEAMAICAQHGAQLFDDIGNKTAMHPIADYVGPMIFFWTGVHKQNTNWVKNNGQLAPGMMWAGHEPSNYLGAENYISVHRATDYRYYFATESDQRRLAFSCQQRTDSS